MIEGNKRLMDMMPDQFNRFQTSGAKPCRQCEVDFVMYDKVISKTSHRKTYYYHKNCWEALFH